ncbi:PKD domain-containing protein [Jiulongibacter sp. NS-SX5]|uniref:PKD domain-containing protein n=1 Tax=Jiulongibacter sp. NS-SX5 TaxID=3463854 RepID=UPI004058E126
MAKTLSKYVLLGLLWIISGVGLKGYAQFYSGKACVLDFEVDPNTGEITGCPVPTYFFDTDSSTTISQWNFGDLSPVVGGRNASHVYQSPGLYSVSLTKFSPSGVTTVTKQIEVGSMPQKPLFNGKPTADTTVCAGGSLTLNPYAPLENPTLNSYDYLWYPGGDTTKTIDVDSSGCYMVEVFDKNTGCSRTARINVTFCYQETSGGGGNESWYFGNGATLEFEFEATLAERDSLAETGSIFGEAEQDTITYTPVSGGSNPLNSETATAMVYGPSGGLAFYTDGVNVFNGEDVAILDSNGVGTLAGNNTASQGVAIIPKNNCNECPHHQYYVFTKDLNTGLLSYSVIDLRYNDGEGMIVERNVPVAYDVSDKLAVRSVDDGLGFEIVTHAERGNQFGIYRVDSSGLSLTPSSVGFPLDENSYSDGYMVFSADQQMIAHSVIIGGQNFIEIFTIDESTGQVILASQINLGIAAPPTVYGLSFNEDGRFLYATLNDPAGIEESSLIQIPIFLLDPTLITNEISVIYSSSTEQFGALQLGPYDPNGPSGKQIYMAVLGSDKIAYIQEPDFQGNAAAVGFIEPDDGVELNGISGLGLPTITYAAQEQGGSGVSATYFGNCFRSTTNLETQGICDPLRNEVEWEFEDGTTLKGTNVNYTFPKVGWNKFKATITVYNTSPIKGFVNNQILNQIINLTESECTQLVLEDSVYIKPAPEIFIGDSLYVCLRSTPVDPVIVDPDVTGGDTFEYLWQTSTGNPLSVGTRDTLQELKIPDNYILEVTNNYECISEEEFEVLEGCLPEVEFPTAFSPNGDASNQNFAFYYKFTDNPNLKIYTRWGELIYETNDLDVLWNGTLKGIPVPTGVYPYVLTYDATDFPDWGRQKVVGSVWVLR